LKTEDLVRDLLRGDSRSVAKAITLVENESPEAVPLLKSIYSKTGRANTLGITGSPGVGKSTLADKLIAEFRKKNLTVGVIAVDPTSPFTGGAILGDRIRMSMHAADRDVFIRSMATRGFMGGLSRATADAVDILDASGKDWIMVETVGVGQDEIDVVELADVTLVLLNPGMGDELQALKAGLMEIADIFVINKADHEGAEKLRKEIEAVLSLVQKDRNVPIVSTVASESKGIGILTEEIRKKFEAISDKNRKRMRREYVEHRLSMILSHRILETVQRDFLKPGEWETILEKVSTREVDPYSTMEEILSRLRGHVEVGSTPSGEIEMVIDHIGIAVQSIEKAGGFYIGLLGHPLSKPEEIAGMGVRVAFVPCGDGRIELIEPARSDSAVAKFLEKRGQGLHHICFRVDDIALTLQKLCKEGWKLIDKEPRPGADGSLVAFIHPEPASGVLVELKQPGGKQKAARELRK
jgi:LAO/AO transport system kinase